MAGGIVSRQALCTQALIHALRKAPKSNKGVSVRIPVERSTFLKGERIESNPKHFERLIKGFPH